MITGVLIKRAGSAHGSNTPQAATHRACLVPRGQRDHASVHDRAQGRAERSGGDEAFGDRPASEVRKLAAVYGAGRPIGTT
jgi:hypothetical protein